MSPQIEQSRAPQGVEATYKSPDVESYIDILFYRPLGFQLAKAFARIKLTPNMVSVIGCVVGLLAGHLYYYRSLALNVIGMLLHITTNTLDNADGQLARIIGSRNPFGRIVDGVADHVVFIGIYFHLALRCGPTLGWSVTIALAIAAAISHALQSAAADYFRSAYLLFGGAAQATALDSTAKIRDELRERRWRDQPGEKLLLMFYRNFTMQQEMLAPSLHTLRSASGATPTWLQTEYPRAAAPLIKWLNALMTNPRMLVLFIALLVDQPVWYFITEVSVFNLILVLVLIRHDRICRSFLARLSAHAGD